MKITYTPCPEPIEKPCLMKSEFGEIFLVTEGSDGKTYVTRVSQGPEEMETWESDLRNYTPLPKGTKVEIVN